MNSEDIIKELKEIKIDLFDTTLLSAAKREERADGRDVDRSRDENTIRGVIVILYFAFLQAHLDELDDSLWYDLKNPDNETLIKGDLKKKFLVMKYVRDCFAHNFDGEMFPDTRTNTKDFENESTARNELGVSIKGRSIVLTDDVSQKTYCLIKKVINEVCS